MACPVGNSVTTSPLTGATTRPPVGSMAKPSPMTRPLKTGSGTSVMGSTRPGMGSVKSAGRAGAPPAVCGMGLGWVVMAGAAGPT